MCTIQYIDRYKNIIVDTFSYIFINLEILPTLSDFIPSKIDSLEPPVSTKINSSLSTPTSSEISPLHLLTISISIVISAVFTTRSMIKKNEETPARYCPLLEIQVPKHQETGSPLAIAISATPALPASALLDPTLALQSAVQTIEQLMKPDLECYHIKKIALFKDDPTNEVFINPAAWHARHALYYWTIYKDTYYLIYKLFYEYKKSFNE